MLYLKLKLSVVYSQFNIGIHMILSKILTINYKSCRSTVIDINNNHPNIFIGMNDCGKTTLLKSLDLLFSPKSSINYYSKNFSNKHSVKSDLSHTPKNILEINKIFLKNGLPILDIDEGDYIVFATKLKLENINYLYGEPTLSFEWLVFSSEQYNNEIWIVKVFDCKNKKSTMYYAMLDSKNEELNRLYLSTKTHVKNIVSKFRLINDTKDKLSQLENMKTLYINNKSEFNYQWCSNKSWIKDIERFPTLRYLDWNQSVETIKKTANDILKESIFNDLKSAEKDANKHSLIAQKKINKELKNRGIHNEVEGIQSIRANVFFKVECQISDLLIKKSNSEDEVHIDNQGEGIKRQLWFSLLKSKAEEKKEISDQRFIWCFDEPETHLHPKAQRKFFSILKSLSLKNFQILISTHSTTFVDSSNISNIINFNKVENYTRVGNFKNIKDIHHSLGLRNSDFLFHDKFIFVEGKTEKALIPRLYKLYMGKYLGDDHIHLVELGGSGNFKTASNSR
jgi:predicted ATP-dependent endonuclease of OLD family